MADGDRPRLGTEDRNDRFVANLKKVADKREGKELLSVATMTDAEKIEYFQNLKREEEKKKLLIQQTGGFKKTSALPKKKPTKVGRSLSHSHQLPGLKRKEPTEVEFTIEEGALGVGVSQSKDATYQMQFDYFTEAGNAAELSNNRLVPKMVLQMLNDEDVGGKPYADLKLVLKEGNRPIKMKWIRSEENLKMGIAHIRGGGIEELEEEWCDLEMTALKEAGAKPVHVKGSVQQERLRGTKTFQKGFRKLVWKDIFLELRRDEAELWKTDTRATSHGRMKLIEVKKISNRVSATAQEVAAGQMNIATLSAIESAEKFPVTIKGEKLEMTVEWRPDQSPVHPFCFLNNDHDPAKADEKENVQRSALAGGMALCQVNGEDVSGESYEHIKKRLAGPRPLELEWYSPQALGSPTKEGGGAESEAQADAGEDGKRGPGILLVGPKEPGSDEIVTWDLRTTTEEDANAWIYAIGHNRALARRAAGIKPQRRRSASWG